MREASLPRLLTSCPSEATNGDPPAGCLAKFRLPVQLTHSRQKDNLGLKDSLCSCSGILQAYGFLTKIARTLCVRVKGAALLSAITFCTRVRVPADQCSITRLASFCLLPLLH